MKENKKNISNFQLLSINWNAWNRLNYRFHCTRWRLMSEIPCTTSTMSWGVRILETSQFIEKLTLSISSRVLLLDGHSAIGAHLWRNQGYLICWSRDVTNQFFFKDLVSFTCGMKFHLLWIPWNIYLIWIVHSGSQRPYLRLLGEDAIITVPITGQPSFVQPITGQQSNIRPITVQKSKQLRKEDSRRSETARNIIWYYLFSSFFSLIKFFG